LGVGEPVLSENNIAREIDIELQTHIEMRIQNNITAGMSPVSLC
jgi:hypothetical protein